MGDDHHRRIARVDHAFEPADRVDVQVVGRLVEQQDVRIGEQRLREQHAQLPARRHRTHRSLVLFRGNAEAQQQFAGARLRRVAAQFREMRLEVGGAHVVLFAWRRGWRRCASRSFFVSHNSACPISTTSSTRCVLVFELVLAQLAQPLALVDGDIAIGSFEVAAEDLHQRRFAAAVGADQPVAVAVAELDRHVFEERLGAELDCEICSSEHGEYRSGSESGAAKPEGGTPDRRGNPLFC